MFLLYFIAGFQTPSNRGDLLLERRKVLATTTALVSDPF